MSVSTGVVRSFTEGVETGNIHLVALLSNGTRVAISCFNANLLNPGDPDLRRFQGPGSVSGGEFDAIAVDTVFAAKRRAGGPDPVTGLEWDLSELAQTGSEDTHFFVLSSVCTQEPVFPPNPIIGTKVAITLTQAEAAGAAAGRKELRAASGL